MRWIFLSCMHGFYVAYMHWAGRCIGVVYVWVWFGPRIWNSLIRNLTRSPSRRTDSVSNHVAIDSTYFISMLRVCSSRDTSRLHVRPISCADPEVILIIGNDGPKITIKSCKVNRNMSSPMVKELSRSEQNSWSCGRSCPNDSVCCAMISRYDRKFTRSQRLLQCTSGAATRQNDSLGYGLRRPAVRFVVVVLVGEVDFGCCAVIFRFDRNCTLCHRLHWPNRDAMLPDMSCRYASMLNAIAIVRMCESEWMMS